MIPPPVFPEMVELVTARLPLLLKIPVPVLPEMVELVMVVAP